MVTNRWDHLLAPYLNRVVVKRGNGLSKDMNKCLRCYGRIREIIRRTGIWLLEAEAAFGYSGVRIRTVLLRKDLSFSYDDWCKEVPVMGDGRLQFKLVTSLTVQEFASAMTIARRIGLLAGHGQLALTPGVRQKARKASSNQAA